MVIIRMMQIGWFHLPLMDPIVAILTWSMFLGAFFFRRKVTGDGGRRTFLVINLGALVLGEFLWYLVPGFARYGFMLMDHIALTLLAGYGLGAAWPYIKEWWKENT